MTSSNADRNGQVRLQRAKRFNLLANAVRKQNALKAGLVSGSHGKGGGYTLLRSPSDIMIGTVLRVTEGSIATVACLENGGVECERAAYCKTLPMWRKLDSLITEYLDSVSLQDLIDGTSGSQPACPYDVLPEDSSQL